MVVGRIRNAMTRRRTMPAVDAEWHKHLWTRLRDALLNDFHKDRWTSEQNDQRHQLSEYGELLHVTLAMIGAFAWLGFEYYYFSNEELVWERSKPPATYQCFLDLVLFHGERIARDTLDDVHRLVHERFEDRPEYLYVMLGGPIATVELVEVILRVIDLLYLGVHGDYAVHIAEWMLEIELNRYFSGLETSSRQGDGEAEALADALWLYAGGDALRKALGSFKRDIALWVDEKPVGRSVPEWPLPPEDIARGSIGFTVHDFLIPRLEKLAVIVCGKIERRGKQLVSTMKIQGCDPEKTVTAWLNAGAYPRGGRKPPSVTHGTTYGVDLDLAIKNAPRLPSEAAGRLEAGIWTRISKHFRQRGVDVREFGPTLYKNGTDDYLYAVAFTQAIILTLPSRFYYGDHVVLAAAVGGIKDKLDEIEAAMRDRERTDRLEPTERGAVDSEVKEAAQDKHITWEKCQELEKTREVAVLRLKVLDIPEIRILIDYEPVGHFNHWHVDWLEEKVTLDKYQKKAPSSAFFERKAVRPIGDERNPLPSRNQLVRPVYIGGKCKLPAGSVDEIEDLLGVLTPGEKQPLRLPIGDVENPEKIIEWLEKYFHGKKVIG